MSRAGPERGGRPESGPGPEGDFTVPADWVRDALPLTGPRPGAAALAAAGLTRTDLDPAEAVIGQRREAAFFQALDEQMPGSCHAAALGLRMPGSTSTIVSYVLHGSRSMSAAMEAAARLLRLTRPGLRLAFGQSPGGGHWRAESLDPWVFQLPGYQEFIVSAVIAEFRGATGRPVRPAAVLLGTASRGHEARLAELWGCKVAIAGADRLELHYDAATLALPLEEHDPDLLRHLERYGRMLLEESPRAEEGLRHRVERAVLSRLSGGAPSLAATAQDLGLSTRTLTRRLQEQGLGYRELVEEVRRRKALLMLADRGLSLAEIAFLLGYAEQSSFSTAFRRWTGRSPGAFRAALPHDAGSRRFGA
ncbi:helix-turn-helix domain-containing protein [Mangrovicoccus algicola]|uniref:Helix-turn-helix domain-containing protein n=1 Tax=Mangrovicoccus algicola TaxID=2771008 RepID=A0A8J6Z0Y7_9RHOB|nr:AraC family transcriptional regulator [Mangrovicoccus algicola]MBE3639471.1 helix-turn-helix domain-containing protein [Mangrovicoccus algicola]